MTQIDLYPHDLILGVKVFFKFMLIFSYTLSQKISVEYSGELVKFI